jgi:hypothetical protein
MEWLGILFLYLISGFMKKRQQNAKRRQIESDPGWDPEHNNSDNIAQSPNSLDQLLNDLFEENPKIPEVDTKVREVVKSINVQPISRNERDEDIEKSSMGKTDLSSPEESTEGLKEKIYHSNLADRDEQHYGVKWQKTVNMRKELFSSKKSLKKSIIIKEILDRPLALRK